ncbi:hypothetical protein [Cumulibacter soli]|uniref:hypothetical protein n=1 Tax=Cumulibacter soli TaxID=2546344 RepID=UPI001ABA86CC|nr:hypothetical protein [Cumulibacter soli]
MPETTTDGSRRAVAEIYHAFFTGIILSTVTRAGRDRATRLTYEVFNRQRAEKFVPGLAKLGIDHLPPAVAAASYHYLSNHIGGVKVKFMPESDRKAWIRYDVPRWAWAGTALCAIPSEVSEAMLRGWHARNGLALGNPRLGFVCTKQAADGDDALEGYYFEYDEALEPTERLRFSRTEDAPDFDPELAPKLPTTDWPEQRLAKAHRSYAMTYPQTALSVAANLWGIEDSSALLGLSAKQVGMQIYDDICAILQVTPDGTAENYIAILKQILDGHDDEYTSDGNSLTQQTWRFGAGVTNQEIARRVWPRLFEGMLAAHNHRLALEVTPSASGFNWRVITKPR